MPRKLKSPVPLWPEAPPAANREKFDQRLPLLGRFSSVVLLRLVVIAAELVSRPGVSERTSTVSLRPPTARCGASEVILPTSIATEGASHGAKLAVLMSTA